MRLSPKESEVQKACLDLLKIHPKIAWVHRMNVGGMTRTYRKRGVNEVGERYIRFAFKGCSDIIGQMRDGRFFAWEVKRPGKQPTTDQQAFSDAVNGAGGVAGWSDNVGTLYKFLQTLEMLPPEVLQFKRPLLEMN